MLQLVIMCGTLGLGLYLANNQVIQFDDYSIEQRSPNVTMGLRLQSKSQQTYPILVCAILQMKAPLTYLPISLSTSNTKLITTSTENPTGESYLGQQHEDSGSYVFI